MILRLHSEYGTTVLVASSSALWGPYRALYDWLYQGCGRVPLKPPSGGAAGRPRTSGPHGFTGGIWEPEQRTTRKIRGVYEGCKDPSIWVLLCLSLSEGKSHWRNETPCCLPFRRCVEQGYIRAKNSYMPTPEDQRIYMYICQYPNT